MACDKLLVDEKRVLKVTGAHCSLTAAVPRDCDSEARTALNENALKR